MPYLTQNNRNFFYTATHTEQTGEPALVLVHGAGASHQDWPAQWRQPGLPPPANLPLYALDLPGHRHSDPPARTRIEAYARDLLDFIEGLGLEQVVIAGHSMGGAIALTIGLWHPALLSGLVLMNSGARLPVNRMILDGLQTDFANTVQLIMKYAWHKNASPTPRQQATQRLLATPPEVVYGDFMACNNFDLSDRLEQISVPTLVIGADEDKMTPLSYSQFLAEQIPQAQLAVIEQAGHYMPVEKTAAVTAPIASFLAQFS